MKFNKRKNEINITTNTNGGKNMKTNMKKMGKEMKDYAVGIAGLTMFTAVCGFGFELGKTGAKKLNSAAHNFIESQKLSDEEFEEKPIKILIGNIKKYKPSFADHLEDEFFEEEAVEETDTTPVVTEEDVTAIAAEILEEAKEEKSSDVSETEEEKEEA